MSDGLASFTDKLPATPSVTVGPSLPGEGFAKAVGAIVGLVNTVQKEVNTPAMVQAAIEEHAQAAKDELQKVIQHAIETGDVSQLQHLMAIVPGAS